MVATALDLSQIKTDALSSAATFRSLIELGSTDTPTFKGSTLTGGTVTASTPVINATQTWNDAAVTFTGIKLDVTDTASADGSLLIDLRRNNVSYFRLKKDGYLHQGIEGNRIGPFNNTLNNDFIVERYGHPTYFVNIAPFGKRITLQARYGEFELRFQRPYSTPTIFTEDDSGIFAQRNGTNAQEYRLYNTYTDASNYERAFLKWDANVFKIGTEAAGTGTVRTLTIENVAKINGSTSSAADPSTTEYPNDGDHGIHKNTTSGNVFLAYNDGGSSIVKVQLS